MSRVTHPPAPGIGWAYTGVIFGGLVSIAANLAHSYVPPPGVTDPNWTPVIGAQFFAVFWPVALFVALEEMSRIRWAGASWEWQALRVIGFTPVVLVAAGVSYGHMNGLLRHYGESGGTARLGPLAVDGIMVMSASALLLIAQQRRARPAPASDTVTATTTPGVIDFAGHPAEQVVTMPVPPSARPKHRERHTGTAKVAQPTVPIDPGDPRLPGARQFPSLTDRNAAIFADAFPGRTPLDADTDTLPKELLAKLGAVYDVNPRTIRRAVQDHKKAALANVDQALNAVELSPREETE